MDIPDVTEPLLMPLEAILCQQCAELARPIGATSFLILHTRIGSLNTVPSYSN